LLADLQAEPAVELVTPSSCPSRVGLDRHDEAVGAQPVERRLNVALAQLHHGLAVGALVAAGDEGLEGERVVVRRCEGLLDEDAEDPGCRERQLEALAGGRRPGRGRLVRHRLL
jgi:hypothetical protein